MAPGYEAAEGMRAFLSGTPPVLALAAVDEGVRVVAQAGLDGIRVKGIALTEVALALADARLAEFGVRVASPLTTRFVDVWDGVDALRELLARGAPPGSD